MRISSDFELTYCTNIHPATGWPDVLQNLREYAPALKKRLSPENLFGLGLRLSAHEAEELSSGNSLEEFREFLRASGLYVALINGFPHGDFHGTPVKDQVFAPDWQTTARTDYTLQLIRILSELDAGGENDFGVSTSPLSYKPWMGDDTEAAWVLILPNLMKCVDRMAEIRFRTGRYIHLDIEPEPSGLVETSAEFVEFFNRLLENQPERASDIRAHICVCLDICHAAVEFEDPVQAVGRFEQAGIRIGRVQISSALRVTVPEGLTARSQLAVNLEPFLNDVYLHQVIEDGHGRELQRYADLPDALACMEGCAGGEWRIHFHVPLFTSAYGAFGSTQDVILDLFAVLKAKPFTRHLEIETYTWSVLPADLKQDLLSSIQREYDWVLDELCKKSQPSTLSDSLAI